MTLGDLIRKAREVGDMFNTYDIPLFDEAYCEVQDIEFTVEDDDKDGYYIQMIVK